MRLRKFSSNNSNLQLVNISESAKHKTKKVAISDDFSLLVAGEQQISNFLEGYEKVIDLYKYMNR